MKREIIKATLCIAIALIMGSCGEKKFHIEGIVDCVNDENAGSVVLERTGLDGTWVTVDSTLLSGSGKFSFESEAPQVPEIYRLRLGDRYIYIPVDSTETVSVKTTFDGFGQDFTLEGSENARKMEKFEKEFLSFLPHFENTDSATAFKRHVYSNYLQDSRGSVVSYYILTKTVGRQPLFSPENDYAYFSAVATGFRQYNPDDPRTALLEQTAVEGRRLRNKANGNQRVLEAEELSIIEITLPDEAGKMQSLSRLASNGKPTILVFSNMMQEGAGEFNMALRQFYQNKGGRVDIYQVSLDPSRHTWSDAAINLPWTTVYAGDGETGDRVALAYNISMLPTMYIIDSKGQLIDRADDLETLKRKTHNL